MCGGALKCYLLKPHTLSKIVCASAASPLLPEPGSSGEQSENSLTSPSSAFIRRHLRLRSFCSAFWLWLRRTESLRLTPLVIRVAHLLEPHTLSKIVCASAASPLLPEPGSSGEQSENSLTSPSSAFIWRHLR